MIVQGQEQLTDAVVEVMRRTADPRQREIMVALVRHLHGFVREVRLTEAEFQTATAILNEMGKLTSDTHNEMVLMAGSLGVSSLVCLLNNGDNGTTETSQSLLGPFWRMHSPQVANGGSIVRSETPGPTAVRQLQAAGPRRAADRRGGDRYLALLAGRPVREPGPRPGRHEPARQVHHRCRRPVLVPHGQAGGLPDPDRRRGRPAAPSAGSPPLPPGACARAGVQGRATRP